MENPFFSVIMPLYNKAKYVVRALETVFAQTFDDFELVVVDDGSSDDSLAVVEHYFEAKGGMPPNVTVVLQPHSGVGEARNNGVAHSNGKYLTFIDADDGGLRIICSRCGG